MASQTKLRNTARQYQIEDRRRQVAIMVAQGMSEVEIAAKLGVDNTTISKDIKAMKLISQQFIYDITTSDFTYYYKQCLDMVKFILRKQCEIVDKANITKQDMCRAKVLGDLVNTINTLNGYYNAAPNMHRIPMQIAYATDRFGIRPGTRTHKLTPEEEERLSKEKKLFYEEGMDPIEVAIALNLEASEAKRYYTDFWELNNMESLARLHKQIGNEGISWLLRLYVIARTKGISTDQIIEYVSIYGEDLPMVKKMYVNTNNELQAALSNSSVQ